MPLLFLGGFEVGREARARSDGDDRAFVLPDALEELGDELASLGGRGLDLPEAAEVREQFGGLVELRVGRRAEAFQLLLQRLAAHDVLRLGEVAHDVEVLEARELGGEVAAAGAVCVGVVRCLADRLEHALAQRVVGLEVAQPVHALRLKRLGLHDRLAARVAMAARRADVAAHGRARPARAVHARATTLAVEELAQQVLVGRRPGLQHPRAPRAHLLHAIEQLLRDDRLVAATDLAGLVAQAGDVAAVRGVDEHLAHGVLGERTALGRARALRVEPGRDRAVGLLPGRVALEHAAHERRSLGVRHGLPAVRVAHVAPRELADEVTLSRLLGEAGAGPERERDGVVLVEHLVNRLGQERRRVAGVVAHRLRHRDDADCEPLAQQSLVTARLDLVAREARGVKDEHDIEAPLGRVGHQSLELGTAVGLAPAGVEVAVLADDREVVLGGELRDGLALRVGGEALTLALWADKPAMALLGAAPELREMVPLEHRRAVRAGSVAEDTWVGFFPWTGQSSVQEVQS